MFQGGPAAVASRALLDSFARGHPRELALWLEGQGAAAAPVLLALEPDAVAGVLRETPLAAGAGYLGQLEHEACARCLAALPLDLAAPLARLLSREKIAPVLSLLPADLSRGLAALMTYPEGSAGSVMDPFALALHERLDAATALDQVRRHRGRAGYYLYTVAEDQVLRGVLTLKELIAAGAATPLVDLATARPVAIAARAGRAALLTHPDWVRYRSLPVVEGERFVGVLHFEQLQQLRDQEAGRTPAEPDPVRAFGEVYSVGVTSLGGMLGELLRSREDR